MLLDAAESDSRRNVTEGLQMNQSMNIGFPVAYINCFSTKVVD